PPRALEVSQDRLVEKRFLKHAGLPTAGLVPSGSEAELAHALETFGAGVLKTRRLGYDGQGQLVMSGPADAPAALAWARGAELILEAFVSFEREVSVIAARGMDGSLVAWDPVENVHRDGILRTSTVPASIGRETADLSKAMAFSILGALDYVGVIGV